MQIPALPPDELERLHALQALRILDTPPEERFNRLVRLAHNLFDVPIALVSLVDSERQWFKACIGLDASQTSREVSFCGHAILSKELFCVPNALDDPRFADNPLVTGPPHIRFYIGAPLTLTSGYRVGTLCLIDRSPRRFTDVQRSLLRDLADVVEQQLEIQLVHQLEKTLHIEKARHHLLFDAVHDGIVIIDQYGMMQEINPSAERMFGYDAATLIGKNLDMLVAAASRDKLEAYLGQTRRNWQAVLTERQVCELTGVSRNGLELPFELLLSPMQLDEQVLFAGVLRDLSERKVMERMKNEFISTVSHELRTPLTSIHGALGLVLGKLSEGLSDKARMLLTTASRNSERLSLLINDILDLEKIESGKMDFDFRETGLAALLRQALAANEGYADKHQVTLHLQGHIPDDSYVFVDEHRLLQVFANLLSNAIKYSPAGAAVDINVQGQAEHWRIGVRDYGRGIPPEFKERMFQRFAQADSSDVREKSGTGLGLSISKAIVERHGGMIAFDSTPGQGSEFYFTLPRHHPGHLRPAPDDDSPFVLICEDNADVAMILAELLKQEGIVADIAHNGAEARSKLHDCHYNALLLDLMLPDMDGLALMQELRQQPQFMDLPIIIVSGKLTAAEARNAGEALAIIDWLQKPVDRSQLSHALRRALRHRDGKPSLLHVEDDLDIVQVTQTLVEEMASYEYATSLAQARVMLAHRSYDLVLLDLGLPDGSGLDLLPAIASDSQVLIFSAQDHSGQLSDQISMALTKTRTSHEQLLATIKKLIV